MSDDDIISVMRQHYPAPPPPVSGPLSNAGSEGLLSGAAKGAATGAIKGLSNSLGTAGNLSNFANYLVARGESAITGRPYEEVSKEHEAKRVAMEAANPLLKYTNPANVFPSGAQVAAPILAKTGEYAPSSELGRLAQAGVETAAGMSQGKYAEAVDFRQRALAILEKALGPSHPRRDM